MIAEEIVDMKGFVFDHSLMVLYHVTMALVLRGLNLCGLPGWPEPQ
jgi:hypothetical protein